MTAFERTPGEPLRCVHCGEVETDHQWRCSTCDRVLKVDAHNLPAEKMCHDYATLWCVTPPCCHPDPSTVQTVWCRRCGYWVDGDRVGPALEPGLREMLRKAFDRSLCPDDFGMQWYACDACVFPRKPYSTPKLTRYGTLADITLAIGNKGNPDGGGPGNGMSRSA